MPSTGYGINPELGHFRDAFYLRVQIGIYVRNQSYENVSPTPPYNFIFMQIKLISLWKALPEDSFWNRGKMQLGSHLLQPIRQSVSQEISSENNRKTPRG